MIPVAELARRPAAWLHSPGADDGIVVSTRIRLARNSAEHAFPRQLDRTQQQDLVSFMLERLSRATQWEESLTYHLRDLEIPERQALGERQLISRDLANGKRVSALYASADESMAMMINEEDHLRLQVITHGLALEDSLTRAVELDQALENHVNWAVHPRFGYLSACPTNAGTGLRASVMLHVPALAETQDLRQVLRGLSKLHMTVRGLHGEGSEASGHFYQVSNQRSLGHTEPEIVAHIHEAVGRIIEYERLARTALLTRHRNRIEDRVWRAFGLLTHARSIAYDEVIDQLSWVRLGVALELLPLRNWTLLDRILVQTQPAHLELHHAEAGAPAVRDRLRAELVRGWLTA